jgi:hypothetical protein
LFNQGYRLYTYLGLGLFWLRSSVLTSSALHTTIVAEDLLLPSWQVVRVILVLRREHLWINRWFVRCMSLWVFYMAVWVDLFSWPRWGCRGYSWGICCWTPKQRSLRSLGEIGLRWKSLRLDLREILSQEMGSERVSWAELGQLLGDAGQADVGVPSRSTNRLSHDRSSALFVDDLRSSVSSRLSRCPRTFRQPITLRRYSMPLQPSTRG